MKSPALRAVFWLCMAAVAFAPEAGAQGDLDAGKTGAQLFASHCNACHRSPQGLAKQTIGLTSFLRQHYTTNSTHAAALAEYVSTAGPDPRAGRAAPAERATGRQAARTPVDPRLPVDPNTPAAPAPPSAAERPKPPPVRRDSRLPVSVSTDPDPFVISREPMPVAEDSTPRRVISAMPPSAPSAPATPTVAAAAEASSDAAAPVAAADRAQTEISDQPAFSAPLP